MQIQKNVKPSCQKTNEKIKRKEKLRGRERPIE